jgi:nucleoid-associated protein YgaU
MGGFLKKLNPFGRGDKKKQQEEERRAEQVASEASAPSESPSEPATTGTVVAEAEATTGAGSTAVMEESATAVETSEGKVTGSGLERKYTTKAGDKLEDIAAYFYGDPVHKQRLIDDNPALANWDGRELPGGLTINVSEDPNRGDAVSTA